MIHLNHNSMNTLIIKSKSFQPYMELEVGINVLKLIKNLNI